MSGFSALLSLKLQMTPASPSKGAEANISFPGERP